LLYLTLTQNEKARSLLRAGGIFRNWQMMSVPGLGFSISHLGEYCNPVATALGADLIVTTIH
jgi:hypothetical protein